MVTGLLIVIYIAFIGAGLPHSLFGVAMPAIQTEFAVSNEATGYVPLVVSACIMVASMFGARLVNRFGTRSVILASATVAALSLLGFSFAGGLAAMLLLAIPLGLSSGATDAALNNYVSLHYSAMCLNFMHCFFGIGNIISPYIMSVMLESSGWRGGYRAICLVQLGITAVILLSLPLWKKARHSSQAAGEEEDFTPQNLSYIAMAKTPAIRLDWLIIFAVNVIEGVIGTWGSSYLINAHHFTESSAAGFITMFYIGIALGRFLSGLLSNKVPSWTFMKLSGGLMLLGTCFMFVPVPMVAVAGLFLVGLGNGPLYPGMMYMTPRHFGKEVSASVLGSQIAVAYLGFMIGPPIFGYISSAISTAVLPAFLTVLNIMFATATLLFLRKMKGKDLS